MSVKRRRYGRGHAYYVDGEKVPGVTSVLKMLPKDALVGWAGRVTAEYALDNWDALAAMRPSERLRAMQAARNDTRDRAAHRGTEIHTIAARLAEGESVIVPEEIEGHVDAYRDFLDTIGPVPLLGGTELVVASREHRYCGTADLVADLPPVAWQSQIIPACRWLLELKSTASGVWPESALQSCAYERADVFVDPAHPEEERPMSWLQIERAGVVWIKSDTWELRPVDTGPETWEFFLHLRWLFDHADARETWIGSPAAPAPADLASVP